MGCYGTNSGLESQFAGKKENPVFKIKFPVWMSQEAVVRCRSFSSIVQINMQEQNSLVIQTKPEIVHGIQALLILLLCCYPVTFCLTAYNFRRAKRQGYLEEEGLLPFIIPFKPIITVEHHL